MEKLILFLISQVAAKGSASCEIRPGNNCCDGVDLACFGCHAGLLNTGTECDNQPTSTFVTGGQARDCYCDASCIEFGDCCNDHAVTCARLYAPTTTKKSLTTSKTTTLKITTTTIITTTTKTTTTTISSTHIKLTSSPSTEIKSTKPTFTSIISTSTPNTSTKLTTSINKQCPPSQFLKNVHNIGNQEYTMSVSWDRTLIKNKVLETFTVTCSHSSLQMIKTDFTVSTHKRSISNYCKKFKTVKCGERQEENLTDNFDGECTCGAKNIVNQFNNTSMEPYIIHARCSAAIKPIKEKWEIFCNGKLKKITKVRHCQVEKNMQCGNDEQNTCTMGKKDVVKYVNYTKENGLASNPKKTTAECISFTTKFDTWTIFCDRNKNGKPDKFEEQETYTFRANDKKARRAKMKLLCD